MLTVCGITSFFTSHDESAAEMLLLWDKCERAMGGRSATAGAMLGCAMVRPCRKQTAPRRMRQPAVELPEEEVNSGFQQKERNTPI